MTYGERLAKAAFQDPDPGLSIYYQKTEASLFRELTAGVVRTFVVWGARHIAAGDWLRVTSELETGKWFRRFTRAGPFVAFDEVPERQRHMATFRIEKVVRTHPPRAAADPLLRSPAGYTNDTAVVVEISAPF